MNDAEKKAAIDEAWAVYRHTSVNIPRNVPWDVYLDRDSIAWNVYKAREKTILTMR